MIAFVAIGILAGAVSFATALFMGASFWFALMLYSLVGAASVLVAAVIPLIVGEKTARGAEDPQNLPVPEPVSEAVVEPQAYLAQGGMRILAVDDDPIILGLIPRIAAEVGCADTTISSSGAQALSLLEQSFRPYDCLLLDINMPGIDGIELCGRIRQIAAYRDTPIIMLTAMKDLDHLDRAFRAGASDYISKPFDVIAFGTCLRNVQDKILLSQMEPPAEAAPATTAAPEAEDWIVPAPGSIAGVETLIEHAALQNYLIRLSGVALSGAYVLAVEVERNAGLAEGPVALAPVVAAISAAFTKQPCVLSYAGDGQFIVVSNSASMPDPSALERAIEDALRTQTGPTLAAGLTVNVGMAVRPGSGRTLRAKTAIESALRLSASRAAGRKTVARAFGGLRS
ncbi:MAG: response regulator [Pseudotabrizicola sp.]|uniref:response regulator n=1 Tax=Pseudotabrizicola sp. TaxID=2939647 RepID=UPI0027175A94|nr:response regulator [Pseudotabrizicola sp.]MDO9640876.1 response regulator [Pseudotabrizicola sp.]